jgi:hypothetical protein
MALYTFQHPETEDLVEVSQSMKDKHFYVDNDGVEWKRVFDVPNAAVDSGVDPFSKDDFMRHTAKNKMTAGQMMDLSKDLSDKREKSRGLDPIKQKAVTSYEKKTGKPHPLKDQ